MGPYKTADVGSLSVSLTHPSPRALGWVLKPAVVLPPSQSCMHV